MNDSPETRYAKSGNCHIAYQVVGKGPLDVVFITGFISHVEHGWDHPGLAHFYRRIASFARLILFDKRGTGMSDPVPLEQLPTLEERMDDVRAVMDAVGSERAARAVQLGDSRWHQLLDNFYGVARRQLERFRGREIDTAGDGMFAAFDGPARAIRGDRQWCSHAWPGDTRRRAHRRVRSDGHQDRRYCGTYWRSRRKPGKSGRSTGLGYGQGSGGGIGTDVR